MTIFSSYYFTFKTLIIKIGQKYCRCDNYLLCVKKKSLEPFSKKKLKKLTSEQVALGKLALVLSYVIWEQL